MAIISDIKQAFLQLVLDEGDRDLTKFLWYKPTQYNGRYHTTDKVVAYCFTRVPFGLTYSPFLLSATLRDHAERHMNTFPNVALLIDGNMFMDDFASDAEDKNGVITLYYELIH